MNHKVRIIKDGVQRPKEPELDRQEQPGPQSTREITTTIKLWVSEFKERRRTDEQHSRNAHKLIFTALSLWLVLFLGGWTQSNGQQLRDAFHKVEQSVVVIRTAERELAPFLKGEWLVPTVWAPEFSFQAMARYSPPRIWLRRQMRRWWNSQTVN